MKSRVLVVLSPEGSVRVLTDSSEVQVLVVDQAASPGAPLADLGEGKVALDRLLEGLPRLDESAVEQGFEALGAVLDNASTRADLSLEQKAQTRQVLRGWFGRR